MEISQRQRQDTTTRRNDTLLQVIHRQEHPSCQFHLIHWTSWGFHPALIHQSSASPRHHLLTSILAFHHDKVRSPPQICPLFHLKDRGGRKGRTLICLPSHSASALFDGLSSRRDDASTNEAVVAEANANAVNSDTDCPLLHLEDRGGRRGQTPIFLLSHSASALFDGLSSRRDDANANEAAIAEANVNDKANANAT